MLKFYAITCSLMLASSAQAMDASGLEISLAGDMVYDQGLNDSSSAQEKLSMRGAEISFFSPIDHNFEGLMSAAAHDENGQTNFELHELNISTSKLIPRSRLKVGQFFLGVGRLNQIHQHDWPFIRAPRVHEIFFAREGVFDTGLEYGYLLPTERYLDLTLGVTSGHRYGHAHTAGSKPKVPTHYLRLATFSEFSSTNGLQLALNYLGRTDEQSNKMMVPGLELTAKWREGKRQLYLLQSEAWYRHKEDINQLSSNQVGLYVFNQYGITERFLMGLRLDGFKDLSKVNPLNNKKINHIEYVMAPELTWKSSEFATIRAGLSHLFAREEGVTTNQDTRLELQFVFILGSHPAHSF